MKREDEADEASLKRQLPQHVRPNLCALRRPKRWTPVGTAIEGEKKKGR